MFHSNHQPDSKFHRYRTVIRHQREVRFEHTNWRISQRDSRKFIDINGNLAGLWFAIMINNFNPACARRFRSVGWVLKQLPARTISQWEKKRAHQLTLYTLHPAFYLASYATYMAFDLSYILTCYLALYLELCLPVYIRIWHFNLFILFLYLPFWAILTYFLTCSLTFQSSSILTWYLAIWWYLFQLIFHTHSQGNSGILTTVFRAKSQADVDVTLAQNRHGDVHWASSKGLDGSNGEPWWTKLPIEMKRHMRPSKMRKNPRSIASG